MKHKMAIAASVLLGVAVVIFVYINFIAVEYVAAQTTSGEVIWIWTSTLSYDVATPLILIALGSFFFGLVLALYKIVEVLENVWKKRQAEGLSGRRARDV